MIKFKPYFVKDRNIITVYLKDTPSYHKYLNEKVSVILASITSEVVGVEITLEKEEDLNFKRGLPYLSQETIEFIEEITKG